MEGRSGLPTSSDFSAFRPVSTENWCGRAVIELPSTLRVCPALVYPGAYPVKLLPLELHPHNRAVMATYAVFTVLAAQARGGHTAMNVLQSFPLPSV